MIETAVYYHYYYYRVVEGVALGDGAQHELERRLNGEATQPGAADVDEAVAVGQGLAAAGSLAQQLRQQLDGTRVREPARRALQMQYTRLSLCRHRENSKPTRRTDHDTIRDAILTCARKPT